MTERLTPLVLVFDLDGTLTDPRPGIVRCMRYAFDKLGVPCPSNDDILASFIGPSLRGTFGTLLETSDPDLIERAVALYREEYGTAGLFENHVYDGIGPMLDDVGRTASASFVATLKPKPYADRIVRHSDSSVTLPVCMDPTWKGTSATTRPICSPTCWRRRRSRPSMRS